MKVIFLDRDGVINRYPGDKKYVTAWKDFRFLPRAKRALKLLYDNGYKIFVVSNQAGVGKGLFSQRQLDFLTQNMLKAIRKEGVKINEVYYCTHRPEEECLCRKPKIGLIERARREHHLDIKKAYFIGDSILDVRTAHAAKIKSILVLSGRERVSPRLQWEVRPDSVFKDLFEAAYFIVHHK